MNQRIFVVVGLLLAVLLSVPVAAKDLLTRITGQPNPQDLTTLAWQEVVRHHLDSGQRPPRYRMNAYYVDSNLFILSILLPRGNEAYLAAHGFCRRNGRWYLSVNPAESVAPKNVIIKSSDYLTRQLDFWNAPTAFPPISNPTETRQLYRLLQTAATTEQWRIQPRPSLKFINPPTPAREETRTAGAFANLLAEYQDTANVLLGETYVTEDQRVLWIAVDGTCSLFLIRGSGATATITDWYSHLLPSDCQNAQSRICTVPLSYSSPTRTGGAGSSFTVDQLDDGALKQLLTRFFRFGGLNNRDEVFSYLAATIAQPTRLHWWEVFKTSTASLRLEDIAVRQRTDGRIEVSFPVSTGRQTLLCSLMEPQRLQILSLNASTEVQPTPQSMTFARRATQLQARLNDILAAARNGNATAFIVPGATRDQINSLLLQWVQDSGQAWYGSRTFAADGPLVIIEERAGRYRTAIAYFTNDGQRLSNLWVQSWISKQKADAILTSATWPFGP